MFVVVVAAEVGIPVVSNVIRGIITHNENKHRWRVEQHADLHVGGLSNMRFCMLAG